MHSPPLVEIHNQICNYGLGNFNHLTFGSVQTSNSPHLDLSQTEKVQIIADSPMVVVAILKVGNKKNQDLKLKLIDLETNEAIRELKIENGSMYVMNDQCSQRYALQFPQKNGIDCMLLTFRQMNTYEISNIGKTPSFGAIQFGGLISQTFKPIMERNLRAFTFA